MASNTLRPMMLGDLLDCAISLYRKNFLFLCAIIVATDLPLLVARLVATSLIIPSYPFSSASIHRDALASSIARYGMTGLSVLATVLQFSAFAVALSGLYLGRRVTVYHA